MQALSSNLKPINVPIAWIIDDDQSIRWVLEKALAQAHIKTQSFETGDQALMALKNNNNQQPSAIITDIRMPGINGLAMAKQIKTLFPNLPIIVMTAHSDLDSAVASFETGAFEYLPKPFDIDEAVSLAKRALASQNNARSTHTTTPPISQDIIGEAPAMQEVFRAIGRLSKSNMTVLINGESGTGKELVAEALHKHSPRSEAPFIALNMAAIPKDLIESELFGHEKGAFTGAAQHRQGRFEQANGGTLFLDEIGDMPLDTQTRLLRVLAEKEFFRVGGHTPIQSDVRIIAATHQNLELLVKTGLFREDLFHRLNVIRIQIPALNQRREDIPKLARHFLNLAANELAVEPKQLSSEAEQYLTQVHWPGNVRQLENLCRWLTVMVTSQEIIIDDLPSDLQITSAINADNDHPDNWADLLRRWAEKALAKGDNSILDTATPLFEKTLIETALGHTRGRRREAAERLGWGRNTLTRKIKELKLGTEEEPEEADSLS